MNEKLGNRIRQCSNLPSLPAIAIQVLELAQKADVDIAEIARTISKDPALSTKILRTVNSSFYARSQHVGTISHALVILGLQSVKTLVLGFSLVTNLMKGKEKGFKHIDYWRRSIYSATAARTVAIRINLVQQEEAFLAALLKDIGMLVLDQVLGDEYGEINLKAGSHAELCNVERAAIESDHAEVGGFLATGWKLPPVLTTPICFHHNPEGVPDPSLRKLTDVVSLAGRCADVFVEPMPAPAIAAVRQICLAQFQMNEADCDKLLDEIGTRTKETASLFEIQIGSAVSFEAILKKANEALVEITLQSQQQATTLRQEASTLAVQNQQLKKQATTDGLTGLSNRASFDQFLAENFDASVKEKKPLSLLLMDVDKFKSINDKHGHQTGDKVLQALGHLLVTATRSQDLAARYGGEEMCLVLPGTGRSTATAIAESIRRAICAKPITIGMITLPVTASIGVATYEPNGPLRVPAHLLKAADLAVYNAKHSGRNCVRVFTLSAAKPTAA
ncbi:MAG TPA: GGDEF domain-containing protein [Tepidisphaeraceae bacterium]|jgi:diguanylate cyclase (GGDEF)-like protein|nr:GGDEF domain-containing protein [Tepidisphaeraceae bacterium]